jgi:HSP90 family molecular chaperone
MQLAVSDTGIGMSEDELANFLVNIHRQIPLSAENMEEQV